MSDKEGKGKKRRSYSPIEIDESELRKEVNLELEQVMLDLNADESGHVDINVLRPIMRHIIFDKNKKKLENRALFSTIEHLQSKSERETGKKIAYKIRLCGRGSLDFAEEMFFPLWLRNTNLERNQKWTISLRFRLTLHSAAFMDALKKSKRTKNLQPSTIGRLIETNYNDWAKTFTHEMRLQLPKTDDEWSSMFHTLKIDAENNRGVLEAILKETTGVSGDDVSPEKIKNSKVNGPKCGYIIIKNVNRNSKLCDIMEYFDEKGVVVHCVEHLLDTSFRPAKKANKIVVFVENVNDATKPFVINNAPKNLWYKERWEIEDKVLSIEP